MKEMDEHEIPLVIGPRSPLSVYDPAVGVESVDLLPEGLYDRRIPDAISVDMVGLNTIHQDRINNFPSSL